MRIAFAVLGLVGIVLAQPPLADAQRAIVLLRHADRLDSSPDSPLSKAGEARALRLASLLLDAGITAIYTSEFKRTIKTAEPLALALKITPVRLPAADAGADEGIWAPGDCRDRSGRLLEPVRGGAQGKRSAGCPSAEVLRGGR